MIRYVGAVFCRQVIVDKATDAVSVMELIDTIQISGKRDSSSQTISIPFKWALMTIWTRHEWDTPVESQVRIQLITPDGDVIAENIETVDLSERIGKQLIGISDTFVAKGSGIYEWRIYRKDDDEEEWIEEARLPVNVVKTIEE